MIVVKGKPFPFFLAGIAFLWAWNFPFILSIESSSASAFLMAISNALHLGSSLISAMLCTLLSKKLNASLRNMLMFYATLLLVAASFLITWGEFFDAAAIMWVGRFLGGAGQAAAWIMWTYEISRYDWEDIDASFLAWTLLLAGFLGILLLVESLPGALNPLFRSVLLASCALLSFGLFRKAACEDAQCAALPSSVCGGCCDGRLRKGSSLREMGWLFACLGLALSVFFVVTSISQRLCSLPKEFAVFVYFIAALAMFPVAWLVLRLTRQFSPASLYRWAVPTVVAGSVSCVLIPSDLLVFPSLAFALVAIGFESMYHLLFIYLAKRFSEKGLLVAGIGVMTTTVGGMMGLVAVAVIPVDPEALKVALLVAVTAFVAIASATPRSESISGLMTLQGEGNQVFREEKLPAGKGERPYKKVADKLGLTPREYEILEMLMQGRSRTFIRESLFISKGTVDTHIDHIYKKAQVNSKEALERLVCDFPLEEDGQGRN